MELRHFRYFLAVAEDLHFGKAAERLNIAQPALSIQIRKLEEMLGGQLFHRANRSVTLTEAGRIFLDEARQTLERAARAEANVRRALRGELASVEIGYTASAVLSGLLGKAVVAIREKNPDLDLRLHELDPRSQLDGLLQRQIHFAFMTTLALDIPRELTICRLAEWPLTIAMSAAHPLATLQEIPLDKLKQEPFIVYTSSERDDGLAIFRSLADFSPNVAQRASSAVTVAALVGTGLGVALLPLSLASRGSHDSVVFRPIKGEKTIMDCSLVSWRTEYEPAVKLALAAIRKSLID